MKTDKMKIAVLTSGGDAPGMNASIRAVVRCALANNVEVCGFRRGFQGLIENDFVNLTRTSVSDIIQRGGTFLQTERCLEFLEKKYRAIAAENLFKNHCDSLIAIGGDGTFRGAQTLAREFGVKVFGIPGTIDNDLAYTDRTLGFDTAVNSVLWAVNNLRDTMQSHNKVTILEVMGRHCGDIALHSAIGGGAEYALVPEMPFDLKAIAQSIAKSYQSGKKSNLIILAEGAGCVSDIAAEFEKYSGIAPRQTVLGHIQRGGSPTYVDRLLAARFGVFAVEQLVKGVSNRVVGLRGINVFDMDIDTALSKTKQFDIELYNSIKVLN